MQQGPTILIVDDEAIIRDVVTLVLRRGGYQVLAAASGEEALELVLRARDTIALAVLDLVMPDIGGARLLGKMQEIRPAMRALFISGYSTPRGLPPGADFLTKPFTSAELLRAVSQCGNRTIAQSA